MATRDGLEPDENGKGRCPECEGAGFFAMNQRDADDWDEIICDRCHGEHCINIADLEELEGDKGLGRNTHFIETSQ